VEPTVTVSPPAPDDVTKQPDFGVATFERINSSMARITGVPITNGVVSTLYHSEQQSLPAGSLISAFLPSHQTAIAQLANAYCGQLIGTQSLRDAFFGAGLDGSINGGAAGFFRRERQRQPRHRHQCAGQQCGGGERYAGRRRRRAQRGRCAADARSHAQVRRHRRHRHHGGLRRGARQRGS